MFDIDIAYRKAQDFFQCDLDNLALEDHQEMGTRYVDGGYDQSLIFAASHTRVKCEVYWDVAFGAYQVNKMDSVVG